jgi:hypothetical protein
MCIDNDSDVALQCRPNSRSIPHTSAYDAPPPPNSAGIPAENTRRSFNSR